MTELTVAQRVAPADVLRRLISFGEPEFGEADLCRWLNSRDEQL